MKRLALLLLCVAAIATGVRPAAADSTDASKVDPFYGSFGTSVPIAVPEFHGIEPNLSLVYSSTSGNGLAGVGWSLSGFSTIERASPGKGAPAYNASDIFLIDGQAMVPCTAGSTSPSCLTGGTHSTEIENYQRIAFDAAANTWTVTTKDGTKTTYSPVYVVGRGTFRWGVSSVADAKGNAVSYGWWCDPGADCYPKTVSYNGTVVTLYREARPDPITFANGAALGRTNYRVKTIDVGTSGSRVRAYKLVYTTSAGTSRSLLSGVQQFGKDATLDSSGTVTAGTALPAMQNGYGAEATRLGASTAWLAGGGNGQDLPRYFFKDFNGDGKTDMAFVGGDTNLFVALSTGASFAPFAWWGYGGNGADLGRYRFIDVNGDGKTDVLFIGGEPTPSTNYSVALSTGTGFTSFRPWLTGGGNGQDLPRYFFADFNGDGKTDMAFVGGDTNLFVSLSTGSSFAPFAWWGYGGNGADLGRYRFIDVNGDGKTDVFFIGGEPQPNTTYSVALSTGTGFSSFSPWLSGGGNGQDLPRYFFGDFNGDGKTDMAFVGGDTNLFVSLSTGSSYSPFAWWGYGGNGADLGRYRFIDVNGDGKTDVFFIGGEPQPNTNHSVALSTGTNFASFSVWQTGGGNGQDLPRYFFEDFNGDGKTDMAFVGGEPQPNTNHWVSLAGGTANRLETISNGLGSTTTIAYTPSSAWSNTYLPAGMILQTASSTTTTDGRGASSTTNYSYQGGLWSDSERRFLGFRKVTAVIDAAGDYTETYYHQGVGCISKPDATYFRDAAGNIYSYSSYGYSENATAPFTSLLTSRWDFECNQTSSCRRSLTQLGYDTYANPVAVYEYGDYDVAGDERTTIRGFQANTSSYLVLLPAYENVYAGIGTSGPLARQTLFRYDGAASYTTPPTQGLLTAKDRWISQTGGYATATFTHDAWGNRTSETDEDGHTTTHAFDPTYHVFETQRCNALNQCTSYGWDMVLGVKSSEADANGTTSISHDPIGRATQIVSPSGTTVSFSYVSWGDATQAHVRRTVADGSTDGLWTDEYQDGLGRTWRIVKKGGLTKDLLYSDSSQRVWKESLWYGPGDTARYEVRAYDGAGRLRTITHPDGTQAQHLYGNGTETQLDELGNEHVFWKDGLGNVTQIREKNGSDYYYTTKQYDVLGNLTRVIDAKGSVSTYTFDSLSRRTAVSDPDMGTSRYGYSAAGLLTSVTDAAQRTIGFQYDAAGRRTAKLYPDGSEVTWSYDEAGHGASSGRLTSVADMNYTQSFSYGADGQVSSETRCMQGTCETIGRSYDAVGRLSSVTYPDGEVVSNTYDDSGRLSSVPGYVNSIAYDAAGSITSMQFANGTTTSYGYDANRRWLNSAQVTAGATTLYQASYAYDAAARVSSTSSSTDPLMNLTYAYDGLSRLTAVGGAQSESIAYDASGNIVSAAGGAYAYNDPAHAHAATAIGANTYSYDANGNTTSGGGRTLSWDYDNRLSSVASGTSLTSYQYDAGGQRISKTANGTTTLYFGKLADTVGGTLEKYYYAGEVLVAKQSAGIKSWYHADHLGSVRLMTNASGLKLNGYDYDAWGTKVAQSETVSNELGFGGHHQDADSGLVYMNARYYDASTHRFLSADTMVPEQHNPQALNRYAFAFNNPISNIDPTGHAPVVAALVVACVASTTAGIVVSTLAWVAFAITTVGYITHNETLMTIGSVIDGAITGGWVGGIVAAATSPLSPLDPKLKQTIGWAYAAYGLYQNWSNAQDAAAQKANTPGTATAADAGKADATIPPKFDPTKLDHNKGFFENVKTIFEHNASKVQAVGIEGQAGLAGENGLAMSALSVDSSFHMYGILHDTLIDTVSYLTGANMGAGVGLWVNVASNVVLVGAGLRQGWFFKPDFMDSSMRSAQYAHNNLVFAQ